VAPSGSRCATGRRGRRLVVHADAAPEHEASRKFVGGHHWPTHFGKVVAARERGVVGAGPAAERDLQHEQAEADREQHAHAARIGEADRQVGRAPGHPRQQRERQQAAEQVPHHHDGFQQPGHRPHAEQRLEDDHAQREGRRAREVDVRPPQRREQQHPLARDGEGRRGDVLPVHVHRDADRHERGRDEDLGDAMLAATRGEQRKRQHEDAERTGEHAVQLFTPGLVRLDGADGGGDVVGGIACACGHAARPVAGRPVGTAQARIRQAHERAEHDHAERERGGEPRKTVEVAMHRRAVRGALRGVGQASSAAAPSQFTLSKRDRSVRRSAGSKPGA
jgi:hypothetical protein